MKIAMVHDYFTQLGGAEKVAEELYNLLGQYLSHHLEQISHASESHSGEALLGFYIREWHRYTIAAKYINHLFRYALRIERGRHQLI